MFLIKTILCIETAVWITDSGSRNYMNKIIRFLSTVLLISLASEIYADEKLVIVGESWPPYYYVDEGKISGIDVDVAGHILSKLGVEYEFRIYPWKRCWHMLVYGKADVGISGNLKPEG